MFQEDIFFGRVETTQTEEKCHRHTLSLHGEIFLGVAHKNNKVSQHAIAEERAIPILVDLMLTLKTKVFHYEGNLASTILNLFVMHALLNTNLSLVLQIMR